MDISTYIDNSQPLNSDSLKHLQNCVEKYPYYAAARLLLLQNLYILQDKSFDEQLKLSALYLPKREVVHQFIFGNESTDNTISEEVVATHTNSSKDRKIDLIDQFLDKTEASETMTKPIKADATNDYTGFLLELDDIEDNTQENTSRDEKLVESFIDNSTKIELKAEPEYTPELPSNENEEKSSLSEDYFTETLARIYVKQGRYEKALEIIRKLYLAYPKKNSYFADQIRFLEKILINNKQNKK